MEKLSNETYSIQDLSLELLQEYEAEMYRVMSEAKAELDMVRQEIDKKKGIETQPMLIYEEWS